MTKWCSRRLLLKRAGALGLLAAIQPLLPSLRRHALLPATPTRYSRNAERRSDRLVISEKSFTLDGRTGTAMTINGTIPGPLIRLKEGQEVTLRVTNQLKEISSIHWHGLLLPSHMDGVPGVSFGGIHARSHIHLSLSRSSRAGPIGITAIRADRNYKACMRRSFWTQSTRNHFSTIESMS